MPVTVICQRPPVSIAKRAESLKNKQNARYDHRVTHNIVLDTSTIDARGAPNLFLLVKTEKLKLSGHRV